MLDKRTNSFGVNLLCWPVNVVLHLEAVSHLKLLHMSLGFLGFLENNLSLILDLLFFKMIVESCILLSSLSSSLICFHLLIYHDWTFR